MRLSARWQHVQSGVGLVELMIALGLGLLLAAAAGHLFLTNLAAYQLHDDSVRLTESGRYAIDSIARAVRQAGFTDLAESDAIGERSPDIFGWDSRYLKSTAPGVDQPLTPATNGSDILALRFRGSGRDGHADGTMVDCAGLGIAAPQDGQAREDEVGWSIFYVARDQTGEPELICKYRGRNAWSTAAIVRGVESFQVRYAVAQGDGAFPARLLTATQIDALDEQLVLHGANPQQRTQDRVRQSHWNRITAVHVAILLRGTQPVRRDGLDLTHDLFGMAYGDLYAASDPGTRVAESTLPPATRNRLRRVFSATVQVRNARADLS